MGVPFKQYLSGDRIYMCSTCKSHAADHSQLISKVSTASGCQVVVRARRLIGGWFAGVPRPARAGLPLQ